MNKVRILNFGLGMLLIFSIASCAGTQNDLAGSGLMQEVNGQPDNKNNIGLASWEPKPKIVDQGNGLQLLLQASEGMSFIYAAHQDNGGQDLLYRSSHNMGDTFSKPYPINQKSGEVSSHGENGPIIKQGSGIGRYAVWQGGNDLKFARSMNFGRSFTPAIKVNDDNEKSYHSFQAMEVGPDGTIYVVWLDGRGKKSNLPGTSSLYIARSLDQGASFEKNIKIAGDACPCCRPALTFDNSGNVYVAWRHVYKDQNRVVATSISKDKGLTWSEKTLVTEKGWKVNGCPHSGPSIEFQNGKLFVVWYSGSGNRATLQAGISEDEGKSFKYLGDVQGKVLDSNHPDIQMVDGEAWIIFQGRDSKSGDGWGNIRPWILKISSDGSFSEPEPIPFLGGSVAYPYLFVGSGGRIYGTWTEISDKGPQVILCRGRIKS
ncbi:MAG: exo-alpha-sialidase [Nitrospinaceae bacterium]|nr:exo-alpha-sialidase [Nitrospina sp.]MBT5376355.1 exo-alpha-sialidase [Nitrospinaceae bacterium]